MTKRDKYVLAAILVAAFLARAIALVALWDIDPMRGDGRSYFRQSVNILNGEPYSYSRAPGYSFILAAAHLIRGGEPSMTTVRWTNVVLGVVTVLCVYLGATVTYSRRLGEITAAMVALDPRYVTHVVFPIVENGFLPLCIGSLAVVVWTIKKPTVGKSLLGGVLMTLAMLTRSVMMYFVLVSAVLIFLLGAKRWRGNFAHACLFTAAALFTLTPWTVRNYYYYHRFVPISIDDGAQLVRGNLRQRRDLQGIVDEARREAASKRKPNDPRAAAKADTNAEMRRRGIAMILERQPLWIFEKIDKWGPKLLLPGGYILARGGMDPAIVGETGKEVMLWLFVLTHVIVLLLAPIGLARHTRNPGDIVLILYVLYSFAIHITSHGNVIRFQLPYNWILMLYVARLFVDRPCWNGKRIATAALLMIISVASLVTNVSRDLYLSGLEPDRRDEQGRAACAERRERSKEAKTEAEEAYGELENLPEGD